MTSPALLVLCVALVCSNIGIASGRINYENSINMRTFIDGVKQIKKLENNTDLKMETIRTNNVNNNVDNNVSYGSVINVNNLTANNSNIVNFDEIYKDKNSPIVKNLELHRLHLERLEAERREKVNRKNFKPKLKLKPVDVEESERRNRVRREDDLEKCEAFQLNNSTAQKTISHPHDKNSGNKMYYNNANCVTVINATEGQVIQFTFVDMFHIEYHPECAYDYLEIRDGLMGYAKSLDKVCGETFPRQITTSGPHAWLKFKSDETIEYEGFHINIAFIESGTNSHRIPPSCYHDAEGPLYGIIDSRKIDSDCLKRSENHALDVLWTIKTAENTKIFLNFTQYALQKPNECEDNVIQVFGYILEQEAMLGHFCGSVANSITTKGEGGKGDKGNIMYIRMYTSNTGKGSYFSATYTAFRTLDPTKANDHCDTETEFDCEDNTCISADLKCKDTAHCRLKTDQEPEFCSKETESTINQPHILVILVIFSLILSGMSFVFLFKCIRKLYQDHKIIKEHIKQSCEDRLDSLVDSRLTLDAKRLGRDSEPRASLERDNHTNEMFKQQRKFSQQKVRPTSIDSDFIHETHLDLEDEPWRRDVDRGPVDPEEVRIERNGRTRKSDLSKKEESIRSKSKESEEKKQIRDASVNVPDTKESGCQTRESLFQTETAPSSDGSGTTNSRGFSTFGYSGATIVRPSPPAPATNTSEITIELLRQVTPHPEKPQKKLQDRRPISTETTRSAPDVIIVSKPIR
ncbi:uncharacterized protein Neto [Epargyreus clarus]|uniref:uncharacterized protein Neto n=1 Tax=Epargyreus clarus TaxID=520877 RepID=UPI003C2AD30F